MSEVTWEYRLTRQGRIGFNEYGIREVYFDGDKVTSWTEDFAGPWGETEEEFRRDLELQIIATTKPIIDLDKENERMSRERTQRA